MKDQSKPMSLEDIEELLVAAGRVSNHRRFVIAGSLSAIGAVMNPPDAMVMSRDLDMYPQLDPGRGFIEISKELGEDSQFHREHGFYADPITPKLLALPEGWEGRMAPISLKGGVVAFFLDPNDVAIGKLVRSHANDLRWVESGLVEGILNAQTILQRLSSVHVISVEDAERVRSFLTNDADRSENRPVES